MEFESEIEDLLNFPYGREQMRSLNFYIAKRIPKQESFLKKFGSDALDHVVIKPYQSDPRHANLYLNGQIVARSYIQIGDYVSTERLYFV
jgi:hypothetical protein